MIYSKGDCRREQEIPLSTGFEKEEYRSEFRRDFSRLLHSPCFRRLQGKTQLYPGLESDFFRNRLTHSLEVAQIAKSIAFRINNRFKDPQKQPVFIDPDICEFAGIAHDLGHPPFGHQGEEALDECMRNFGGFEGNAQTLRILTKVEKRVKSDDVDNGAEFRLGLNLTYRSLASILKYDNVIPQTKSERDSKHKNKPIKGYYKTEEKIVNSIKKSVLGTKKVSNSKFKTVECQIMDIADDIAYSTYDLEDGLKAGFYNPVDILFSDNDLFKRIAKKISHTMNKKYSATEVKDVLLGIFKEIFATKFEGSISDLKKIEGDILTDLAIQLSQIYHNASKQLANDGYLRADFTSKLVGEFIRGIQFEYDTQNPSLSKVFLDSGIRLKVEVLKTYTYESQILSPRLKVAEFRGKEIVREIFKVISEDEGWRLMPYDYQRLFHYFSSTNEKMRVICDFISGMTDRYAIEFYGRLKSESPETIFKPF